MAPRLVAVDSVDLELPPTVSLVNHAATNAELLDEDVTDKFMTGPGWAFVRGPEIPKVSSSNTGAENDIEIAASLVEVLGSANPVSTTRTATREIKFRQGTYKIALPITMRSCLKLTFDGGGSTFQADTNMTSVFDINGMAYSFLGNFWITSTAGVQVDQGIQTYWDVTGSQRTNTANYYQRILIAPDFVTGAMIGNAGTSVQVDDDTWDHVFVNGAWATGEVSRYQTAYDFGAGSAGNNLTHHIRHARVQSCRYGIWNNGTQVHADMCGFAGAGEASIRQGLLGFGDYGPMRIESAERIFISNTGSANSPMPNLHDVVYSANAINADGEFIKWELGGIMTMRNIYVKSVPTGIVPKIRINPGGGGPARMLVDGLIIGGTDAPYYGPDCFNCIGTGTAQVRGFCEADTVNRSVHMYDFNVPATAAHSGTTYAFTAGDLYKFNTSSSATPVTFNLPIDSALNVPLGSVYESMQGAAGALTYACPGGTITGTLVTPGQWSTIRAVKTAADTWRCTVAS